jgi:hypothetical protein
MWFRGMLAAFVGGGSGAVASGFLAVAQTPAEYNLKEGLQNLLVMIGGTFIVTGIVSVAAYLQRSPLPELEEVQTTILNKPKDHE